MQAELLQIRNELRTKYLERQDAIDSALFAMITGSHCFSLGQPGTAKSELYRDLASRFTGANYFEGLLSRTRPAEAILGPLDLPKLRDSGAFVRRTEGFLPRADLAFLDEVGQLSPTLGHDLHAILNERVCHEVRENGRSVHPVPLRTCFAAGNQTPVEESDEGAALYDRILFRVKVDYLNAGSSFLHLLNRVNLETNEIPTTVDYSEFVKSCEAVNSVVVPVEVIEQMLSIRTQLANHAPEPIIASDRRWMASVKAVQAHAWLFDKNVADMSDLIVLKWILWSDPDEIQPVERLIVAVADKATDQIKSIIDNLIELHDSIREFRGKAKQVREDYAAELQQKHKRMRGEMTRLKEENPDNPEVVKMKFKAENFWNDIYTVLLELPAAKAWSL